MLAVSLASPITARTQELASAAPVGALLELGGGSATIDGYLRSLVATAASSIWLTRSHASGLAAVSVAHFESGSTTAYGEFHGSVVLSRSVHDLASIHIDGGTGSYRGRETSQYAEVSLWLGRSAIDDRASAWLDAGIGRVNAADTRNTAHAAAAARTHMFAGTITARLSVAAIAATVYSDASLAAQWAPFARAGLSEPRLTLGAIGGVRPGARSLGQHVWASGNAMLQIAPAVSLVGFAGVQPLDPARATPAASFTSIALRIAIGATHTTLSQPLIRALEVGSHASVGAEGVDGRRLITVTMGGAQMVELMADFTGWQPIKMQRAGDDVWTARLPIAQGTHRVNVRGDSGRWIAFPGVPAAPDDFGGEAGILLVP